MFSYLHLKSLRNSEFIQFIKNVIEITASKDAKVLRVKDQLDRLTVQLDALMPFFKSEKGSDITKELQEIDSRRDNAFLGIEKQLESYTYHYDEAMRQSAKLLLDSLDNYGSGISRLNYQAETSTVSSIVERWQTKPELKKAISVLNLIYWTSELRKANNLFDDKYLARVKETAHQSEVRAIDLRREIMQGYQEITKHLEAYSTIIKEPVYEEVIDEINQLIEEYNKLLIIRAAKRRKEAAVEGSMEEEMPD